MNEILTCEGLTKSYQKGTNALDGIDLHIGFGRIVGLLGPNGSGKTTLIKLANGLLQPTAGSIKIAGMDPGPDTKAIVSYLPDAAWLPDWMRVEQLVEMFRDFYADFDPAKANEMLEKLELSPKAPLKSLSKGNKEKVQLLIHMILSHHGTQEWGAVSCPAIPEAFALHYIDNLDAKMYMCEEHYEELEPGEITEKKPFGLDNRIYKPNFDK